MKQHQNLILMLPLAKHSILVYNISTSATMHMICESKYVTAPFLLCEYTSVCSLRLLAVSELNKCNINHFEQSAICIAGKLFDVFICCNISGIVNLHAN